MKKRVFAVTFILVACSLHEQTLQAQWMSQTSGTNQTLLGVFFTSANIGTVVGVNGIILRTTNGGTTWISQNSGTTRFLRSVQFVDGNTGTIVGYNGTILQTTDGGAHWTSRASGTTRTFLACISAMPTPAPPWARAPSCAQSTAVCIGKISPVE